MTGPKFQKATINSDGTKVILSYSESLSSTTADKNAFEVKVNDSSVTISSIEINGSNVEFRVTMSSSSSATVTTKIDTISIP